MDWYLGDSDPAQARAVRREVRAYLTRHARDEKGIDDAELVVGEVVANALEHAGGPVWVQVSWLEEQPTLVVWDLGPGFSFPAADPPSIPGIDVADATPGTDVPDVRDVPTLSERGRGVHIASHLSTRLVVVARRGGGARVEVRLPVFRDVRDIHPAPPSTEALPALDEAEPGGFDRDAFLRALVVQLAQRIEHEVSPDTAQRLVGEVGLSIGAQMEAAYRAATQVVDRLRPAQLADCLVRLKLAIGGQFSITEVTDTEIVLTATRCPFGDVVRQAPALCRMTSSVFGGIAARNHDAGATVVLEERIAVGDPGCRVVVRLGEPPDDLGAFAHRYPAPHKA